MGKPIGQNSDREKQQHAAPSLRAGPKNNAENADASTNPGGTVKHKRFVNLNKWLEESRPTDWLMLFVTVALVIYAYRLAQQATLQSQAAIDASSIAKQVARSADSTIRVSLALAESSFVESRIAVSNYERLTRADLRAYVVIRNIEPIKFSVGQPLTTKYEVLNQGKTPARNLFVAHYIIEGENLINDAASLLRGVIAKRIAQGSLVGTNTPLKKSASSIQLMAEEDSVAVYSGRKGLFLIAVVGYADKFNQRHSTWCCVQFYTDGTYSAYPKYNDAD